MDPTLFADVLFVLSGTLSTTLSLLVIYVVIFHSPQSMNGYRRFVVNFTFWDFLFSLSLSTLVKPEIMFPYNGAYVNGLFKHLGDVGAKASLVFIINSASHALSTQFYCLFFRYAILQNNPKLLDFVLSWATWIRGWVIAFAITTSAGIFIFAPIQPTQEEVHREILLLSHSFPNTPLPDFSRIIMYTPPTTIYAVYAGFFIFIGFFIFEMASLSVVFVLLRQLEEKKSSFSKDTYRLHRQLTMALGVQLLTPFLHIVAPFSLFIIYNYPYGTMSYATATLFIVYIEFYGTSNSLITLCMVKPYRIYLQSKARALIKFLTNGRYGKEPEHVMVMMTESTMHSSMV